MFNIFPMRKQRVIKQNIPLQENEFLACVVSPNLPHSEKEEEDFHRYYAVMIEKAYFEELFCRYKNEEIPFFVWNQFGVGSDLLILLKQFIREYEDQTENSSQILNAYAEIITHKLIRSLLGLETHQKFASCMNNVIEAEQYMQENFDRRITVEELAQRCSLSVSHFSRKFKEEYGYPPLRYLLRLRVEKAKKYLKDEDRQITEIALLCGFSDTSHFTECFRKETGVTPTDYRKTYHVAGMSEF